MKNLSKLCLFFSILFLFSSCSLTKAILTEQPLTKQELQTASILFSNEIIQKGKISPHRYFQKPNENEILVDFTTGVVKANDIIRLFTFISYYTKAKFYYKDKSQKIKFTYLFDETDPLWDWGDESLYEPKKGDFSSINVTGLPKKYKFDVIDPYIQELRVGSPLENTHVVQEDLPIIFTGFLIDEKPFKVVLTKMPDKSSVSLRSLIRYQEQETLILDENNNVCASFTIDNYTIYNQPHVSSDEMIVPIGVYSGLFLLLNEY